MPTIHKINRPYLNQAKATPKTNPTAFAHMVETRFYRTQPWRKLRARMLRDEPFCRECQRKDPDSITLATMVDHIKPIKQGGEPMEESNLQPLCESCHSKKRYSERKDTTTKTNLK